MALPYVGDFPLTNTCGDKGGSGGAGVFQSVVIQQCWVSTAREGLQKPSCPGAAGVMGLLLLQHFCIQQQCCKITPRWKKPGPRAGREASRVPCVLQDHRRETHCSDRPGERSQPSS